jgi:hypothetical protein
MTDPKPMSRVAAELERLERAIDRVETALTARDAQASRELEALRKAAEAPAGEDMDAEAVRTVAGRVDRVIARLEAVLGG